MPTHRVKKGEWIGSIAAQGGHTSWETVWDHPKNAKLRKRREPNLLVEGDRVWVPEVEPKELSGESETTHEFRVERDKSRLRIGFIEMQVYLDLFGPIEYKLTAGKHEQEGQITTEGQEIEIPLGLAVEEATLTLDGWQCLLDVGRLDPIKRLSGMQARIANLGWEVGPIDNLIGKRTRRGTRDFQGYYEIGVDGKIGNETRGKAKEIYGI